MGNNIMEDDWVRHFEVLFGEEESVGEGWREEASGETEIEDRWEREITEEVNRVIARVRIRKAAGGDELEPEVWIYATKAARQGLIDLKNKVGSSGRYQWIGKKQ